MPLTIQDDQVKNLRSTLDAARPVYDRFSSGDTNLSEADMAAFGKVYDQANSIIGNTGQ